MKEILDKINKALDDAKLFDISLYDLESSNPFYNYVFVATCMNSRQKNASLRFIEEAGITYDHVEGRESDNWLLIDCGEIIINILSREGRETFALDNLYISKKKLC